MRNRRKAKAPTFVSLFCGCGGLDLGFFDSGYQCAGAYDISPLAIANYNANLGHFAQIRDLNTGLPDSSVLKNVDVLLAGAPCQGFSTVGKRQLDDPRNQLLKTTAKIARQIRPRVVVVENVPGVLAGEHRELWTKLERSLRSADYHVVTVRYAAGHFGLAQQRNRVILIAWRTGAEAQFDFRERQKLALADALQGLASAANHEKDFLRKDTVPALIARHIKPGQKLSNVRSGPSAVHTWQIPEVFGRVTQDERAALEALLRLRRRDRLRGFGDADPVLARAVTKFLGVPAQSLLRSLIGKGYVKRVEGRYDLCKTFNGKYRRLSWNEPSSAVDTRFGDPTLFLHPEENRGFTVREAARIQGFPDRYRFDGPRREQFRLIGNAVPPPMARALAKIIRQVLL